MAVCSSVAALAGETTPARPSIVLIVADDLGWGDVSYHGGDVPTPNIDRLAREGIALERFYTAPVCSPTRAGLMTGRWPLQFGVNGNIAPWEDSGLPAEEQTFAEMLAQEGYATRALFGKWHLGNTLAHHHPLENGFSEFYGLYTGHVDYFTHANHDEVDWHRDHETVLEAGYTTDLIAAEAGAFIDAHAGEHAAGLPFLLVVTFNAPHQPHQAPPECFAEVLHLPPQRRLRSAMISCLDRGIGLILDALDDAGIADDTLVWFLSDNGADVFEGGRNAPLRGSKGFVWEGGIRVPAAIRWPAGALAGGIGSHSLTGYVDVLPTLRGVADAQSPPERPLDGIDVVPMLRGEEERDREWFVFVGTPVGIEQMAVHSGDWKLFWSGEHIVDAPDGPQVVSLYRLPDDPTAAVDLAAVHPDVVASLLEKLRAFRALEPADTVLRTILPPDGWAPPPGWLMPLPEPPNGWLGLTALATLAGLRRGSSSPPWRARAPIPSLDQD